MGGKLSIDYICGILYVNARALILFIRSRDRIRESVELEVFILPSVDVQIAG